MNKSKERPHLFYYWQKLEQGIMKNIAILEDISEIMEDLVCIVTEKKKRAYSSGITSNFQDLRYDLNHLCCQLYSIGARKGKKKRKSQ